MTKYLFAGCTALFVFISSMAAQHPDVHQEPHHKPILEWNGLRYLDVRGSQGDTTGYHIHRNPILYLTIQGTEVWLDEWERDPRTSTLPTGWIGNDFYGPEDTLLHRFAVVGEKPLHIIGVEKFGESTETRLPELEPIYNKEGWCVYELDWETYVYDGFCNEIPAIIPPHAFTLENSATYGSGHIIRPVERGYAPAKGMSSVWLVGRCEL